MANKLKQARVLVTGVFDILHQEHINFLQKAKALGDELIVGIESDKRVKELKGESRPVNNQKIRVNNLKKLQIADRVFILPENMDEQKTREAIIEDIKPDYLAVSSHSPFLQEKQTIIEEFGGKLVVVHEENPAVSTTKVLEKNLSPFLERSK